MRRLLFIPAALFIISSCATSNTPATSNTLHYKWVRAENDLSSDFNKDSYECKKDTLQIQKPELHGSGLIGIMSDSVKSKQYESDCKAMFEDCMRSKGWINMQVP